jgi:hypothetical protein
MPAGRRKAYAPLKKRQATKFKQSQYRGKMRAYKKVVKRKNRNNLRPFVETMTREYPRVTTAGTGEQHFTYHDTTGICAIAENAQMSINAVNIGTGNNHAVPQDFTCVIPKAFYDNWVRGSANGQYQGRVIKPNYLNLKCELDWSAKVKDSEHAALTGIDDNWFVIQGWAKNSVLQQVGDLHSLPTTSDAIGEKMAQIAAKCCHSSGVAGDPLQFESKRKDIVVLKHHKVRVNLNDRYIAGVATLATHDAKPSNTMVFALPTVLNFSWTIKRKQLVRQSEAVTAGTAGICADSWIPFVGFYNRNLSAKAHEVTPDLHCSSKIYYTDM